MKIETLIQNLKDLNGELGNIEVYLEADPNKRLFSYDIMRIDVHVQYDKGDIPEETVLILIPDYRNYSETHETGESFYMNSVNECKEEKTRQFWMVLAENSTYTQVKHDSFTIALKEAKRLAKLHQGTKFFILELISVCIVEDPVHVEMLREPEDDIPF